MIEYQDDFVGVQLNQLRKSGQMENNPYEGKPLELESYFKVPQDTRAIYKFLADSGFKPPKLQALETLREKEQKHEANPSDERRQEVIQARLRYDVLG
jgi:DnaJ homologue, subfamily C, member 28, conserved domain